MQLYQGTKRLRAHPMTRGEYNAYRGWNAPDGEDQTTAGYLVEYEDGGQANDARHAGYISWSPADVFERTYKAVPDRPDLPPHQQRVVAEEHELATKRAALIAFFGKQLFTLIGPEEQARLREQAVHMGAYLDVLRARIAAF